MKKLIASILFFGSFGIAMAQITPGGQWSILPYPPIPHPDNSCGSRTVRQTRLFSGHLEHCESPGHQTLYTNVFDPITNTWGPRLNTAYAYPNSNDAADFWSGYTRNGVYYPGWSKTHTNIKFVDRTKSSCNDFATEAACNGAMVTGKRGSISSAGNNFFAQTWSVWASLFGFNQPDPVAPARNTQGAGNVVNLGDGLEMTSGCLWHGKRVDTAVTTQNQCPTNVCMGANMKLMEIQERIYGYKKQLLGAQTDADRAEIQVIIDRLQANLFEAKLSCDKKACNIVGDDSIGVGGLPGGSGYISCVPKPACACPTPGGVPVQNLDCAPNHSCGRYSQ